MRRLLFEKTGRAVWMSHLDLMRLFQRAFKRADLPLTHTQGFNPRPSVSIALPLSVGVESCCELLDFELEGVTVSNDEICQRLNASLVEGVKVYDVYDSGRKLRDLTYLSCVVTLEYDECTPEGAVEQLETLFSSESLVVPKKTKNGIQDQNIIPMIQELRCVQVSDQELELHAMVCCQNPTLNPMQLVAAIERYLPAIKPSFSKCRRVAIYEKTKNVFR